MNVALIGYGAIGQHVLKSLAPDEPARVTTVLMRPARVEAVQAAVGKAVKVVGAVDEMSDPVPDLAVECAGHAAVADYGEALLRRGIDVLVVSIGALADRAVHDRLVAAARSGGAKLLIPAGAIGGIDALAAARQGGLEAVRYISRKPPAAWTGTPAEVAHDLDALMAPAELFRGPADEAARLYPKNANVAATVALAGAGFDGTEVTLIADPSAGGNVHRIEAEGAFGAFTIELHGKPLPDNPKTSSLTAFSVLRAIRNRAGAVEV